MTTVELTPAEIQLIQLKREQEALVQKEAELKKAADRRCCTSTSYNII